MYPSGENLSSDLEYLLQSGEGPRPALVDALVREFYAPVYRLAQAITNDPNRAAYATVETFISAVLNTHHYRAEEEVSSWLYAQAVKNLRSEYQKIKRERAFKAVLPVFSQPDDFGSSHPESKLDTTFWLAIEALPEQQCLAVLFHDLLNLKEDEIGRLMKVEEKEILSWLASAHRDIWEKLERADFSPDSTEPPGIEELFSISLEQRCPQPDHSSEEIDAIIQEIQFQVGKRRESRQRLVYRTEIFLTLLVSLLVVGLIWGGGRLLPEPEPSAVAGVLRSTEAPPTLRPSPTPWRVVNISYYSEAGDTLGSIAEKLDLPLSDLIDPQTGLQITHDPGALVQPDQFLEFRVRKDLSKLPTSTPVHSVMQSQAALNAQSSLEQIRSRIAQSESLWHTLWADLISIYYGPQGYSGPALRTSRVWVWMQLPGESLTKTFRDGNPFQSPILVKDGISYASGVHGVSAMSQEELLTPELSDLLLPAHSEWFLHGAPVRVLRQESFAGRQAIIVQWEAAPVASESLLRLGVLYTSSDPTSLSFSLAGYRISSLLLTVDTQTGVVLRLRRYADTNGNSTLVQEMAANQIALDVNFPRPGLFDPLIMGILDHTRDFNGHSIADMPEFTPSPSTLGHESMNRTAFPSGYDPSTELLTFQYPPDSPGQDSPLKQEVDLFAGQYFLRSLQLAPISSVVCDRSPDGSKIAYLSNEILEGHTLLDSGTVQWLDLRQPAEIHTPLSELSVTDLAFSPQGRDLALAGYDPQSGSNGIYLLDTSTGEVKLLLPVYDAWSLEWSPDGKYLAFIESSNLEIRSAGEWGAAIMVDVRNKEIIYHIKIPNKDAYLALLASPNEPRTWLPPDWPVYQWGVQFPIYRGMLGNCTQLP